jgi:hypothetical protein
VSSRTARATQGNPVSKNQRKEKKRRMSEGGFRRRNVMGVGDEEKIMGKLIKGYMYEMVFKVYLFYAYESLSMSSDIPEEGMESHYGWL